MRCPKCGYISFDHVENCLKCKKDISGKVDVEGTTYHAAAPSFLRVPGREESAEEEMLVPDSGGFTDDISDPDLDVLAGEDDYSFDDTENEVEISLDEASVNDVDGDFQLEPDEELDSDEEFEFDLDEDEEPVAASSMNVPDELSDISDLAPPQDEEADGMSLSLDDDMSVDDDLDLDGLDLNLGLNDEIDDDSGSLSLSLDDIDLSDDLGAGSDSDLDSLNMDLDLDDLDASEQSSEPKKPAGSLDDISLSLD